MSLQSIINVAETISFNRRKLIGVQYTRNEIVKTSELVGRNPWRMTVKVSALLPYGSTETRNILEGLDKIDRKIPETISFNPSLGAAGGLSWMLDYRGAMSNSELSMLIVDRLGGDGYDYNQMVVSGLPQAGPRSVSTAVLFEAGDFVQVDGLPYPFTVVNRVTRGIGNTVTLTLHRNSFLNPSECAGQGLKVGNQVSFNMVCVNMPTYTVQPGAQQGGYITFDDNFQLYEYTGTLL